MQPVKIGEHSKTVTSVKFSPTGSLVASASADGSISVCNVDTKATKTITESSQTPGINQLKWLNSDSHVVTASEDKQVKVFDVEQGKCILSLPGHRSSVFTVSVHPDINLVLSGSYDECIRMWDIRAKRSIGEIEAHSDPISAVDFNASGSSFASSSYDGLIRIWESAYLKCLKEAYAPGAPPVGSVMWTPNSKYIFSGSFDSVIRLWDIDSKEDMYISKEFPNEFERGVCGYMNTKFSISLAVAQADEKNKKLVTGSEDNNIYLFTVKKNKFEILSGHTDKVYALDCMVRGGCDLIVSGGACADRSVILWQ